MMTSSNPTDRESTFNGFPNPFATPETKATDEYGLATVKALWGQATKLNTAYISRKGRDIINRKYAEGLEGVDKYKNRLDLNGDTSWLNLDFNPVTRIAMIVDNLVGKMMNQRYKITASAIDPESRSIEDEERDKMMAAMILKPIADKLEPLTGIPMVPRDRQIPETDEEAELYWKLNFKQASSIAIEEALSFVFTDLNDLEKIRRTILRDLVVLKKAAIYRYYDKDRMIKVEAVDPLDVIVPYSKTEDFLNIPVQGIMRQYQIQQIAQLTNKYTEAQLFDIARANAGQNNNIGWPNNWSNTYEGYYQTNTSVAGRPWDNFNIGVLEFFFLTTDQESRTEIKREKGGYFFRNKPDKRGAEINRSIQYRYEGSWIVGTDHIYGYKKSENMDRDKMGGVYNPATTLPVSLIYPGIYDMENKSLVERMIPHEDQINLINLRAQTLLIKAKAPGIAVDVGALEGVIKGMSGQVLEPIDLVKIYEQTGNQLYRGTDVDGKQLQHPITFLPNGIGTDLVQLANEYNRQVQMINDVIGYNSAVDASSPNVEALVGTQKMAASATNNSLRPLYQAHTSLIETVAKRVTLMIQDSIEFNNETFVRALGRYAVNTIKFGKKLALCEFGIKIELLPDDEEQMQLEELLKIGLESQPPLLYPSDVIQIRMVLKQNVKLAAQLLVTLENKNQKAAQEQSAQLQSQNAEAQAQGAQAAAMAQAQADMQLTANKLKLLQAEYEYKAKLSAQEFTQNMQIQGVKSNTQLQEAQVIHEGKLQLAAFEHASQPPDTQSAA